MHPKDGPGAKILSGRVLLAISEKENASYMYLYTYRTYQRNIFLLNQGTKYFERKTSEFMLPQLEKACQLGKTGVTKKGRISEATLLASLQVTL